MEKTIKNKIIDSLYKEGIYSEYLPEEYDCKDLLKLKTISLKSTNERPYTYTMNKNDTSLERRTISIPEIGSYINLIKYLESSNVLNQIIKLSKKSTHSFSKIITTTNKIRTFSNPYREEDPMSEKNKDHDFIDNTIIKLRKSTGSLGILKLDIANFYGSFYTHNIAAIGYGAEWAEEQFRLGTSQEKHHDYESLSNLDERVSGLNQKRTHGLLVGPQISFIVSEGLMSTIDFELEEQLKERLGDKVDFIRFVDDYDVFIQSEEDVPLVILLFTKVLEKYGFVLNDNKTEYIKFPYYIYENFKDIVTSYENKITPNQLLDIYSKLANFELSKKQKGGLFFLASNMDHLVNDKNYEESVSLILSIIRKNAKSIPAACDSLLKINDKHYSKKISDVIFDSLFDFLKICINNHYDWEQVWLINTLIKLNHERFSDSLLEIITDKLTELAVVMILNEYDFDENFKRTLLLRAEKSSWFLSYELFRKGIVDEEILKKRFTDNIIIENFKILRNNNCQIYKPSTKDDLEYLPF